MDNVLHLDKLQKGREKRGVVVRVVRKWTAKDNNGQGAPMYVGMVLADSKAASMYAEIPRAVIGTKEYLFHIGSVYLVKKFRVNNAKPYYKPFDASLMIEVTEFTTIEAVPNPPSSIPQLIYNVSPFSSIVAADGAVYKYTDVVGYLSKYTALSSFVPKNKEKVTILRELYLKDLRDEEIKVTLWGDHATDFTVDNVYDPKAGNIVVCLIVGCIPRRLYTDHKKVYLSGSGACTYYLNPDISEAAPFYLKFKDKPFYIDSPATTALPSSSQVQDISLHQKTIAELDKIDPFDFEDGLYKCTVTISSIPEDAAWWYRSCVPCKKKAEQQSDYRYRCPKCLGYNIIPRYILSFRATDVTGEANFFAYDDEARLIIQKDCQSILGPVSAGSSLPPPLKRIIGQTYTFGVDLTDDSCRDSLNRQYLVKSVLQRPARQILLPNAARASATPLQHSGTSNQAIVVNVEASKQVGNQGSQISETSARTEMTPPPTVHDDLRLEKDIGASRPHTARKQLFPDDPTSAKEIVEEQTHHKRKDRDISATDTEQLKRSKVPSDKQTDA